MEERRVQRYNIWIQGQKPTKNKNEQTKFATTAVLLELQWRKTEGKEEQKNWLNEDQTFDMEYTR